MGKVSLNSPTAHLYQSLVSQTVAYPLTNPTLFIIIIIIIMVMLNGEIDSVAI